VAKWVPTFVIVAVVVIFILNFLLEATFSGYMSRDEILTPLMGAVTGAMSAVILARRKNGNNNTHD
jgi:hypothetical protein